MKYIYIAHGYFTTIQIFDCVIMILCLHNNDDDGQVDVIENLVLARYGLVDGAPKLKLSKVPIGLVKYCRQPGGAGKVD